MLTAHHRRLSYTAVQTLEPHEREPVKVPVIGIVDTGVDPTRLPPLPPYVQWDAFQFPRAGRKEQWYARIVEVLKNAGAACTLTDGPESVKRALQLMARRLDGYANHEVGAGLVSIDEAQAFLFLYRR